MKPHFVFFLVLEWILPDEAFAQPQLWEIYSTSNQPFVNVIVDRYESDSLYLKSMNQVIVLHQDSIKYLLRRNESKFGLGFLIGSVAGGVYGGMTSQSSGPFAEMGRGFSTAFGILIGGSVGGAIGLAQGSDTKYHMEKLNQEDKKKLLKRLFPEV